MKKKIKITLILTIKKKIQVDAAQPSHKERIKIQSNLGLPWGYSG